MSERFSNSAEKAYQRSLSQIECEQELANMDPQNRLETEIQNLDTEFTKRKRFNILLTTLTATGMIASISSIVSTHEFTTDLFRIGVIGLYISSGYVFYSGLSLARGAEIKNELNEKINELVKLNVNLFGKKKKNNEFRLGNDGEIVQLEIEENTEPHLSISLDELTKGNRF